MENNINQKLNIVSDSSLDTELIKGSVSPIKIYETIKDYYSFWFNHDDFLYYTFSGTIKLYETILSKYDSYSFKKLNDFVSDLKETMPNKKILLIEDNRPSYTLKIIDKFEPDTTIFLSISIIGNFYTLMIEQNSEINNIVYVSPDDKVKLIFNTIESLMKNNYADYEIIPLNMLRMNFFDLVVAGFNSTNRENGAKDKTVTLMQGLFFDYDLFKEGYWFAGDKRYNSEYFSYEIPSSKISQMKNLFLNKKITLKEL
jgi:hypothetical protein